MTVIERIERHKAYFNTGVTRPIATRIKHLELLRATIKKYEGEILLALNQDLRKPEFEGYATEVGFVLDSITYFIKNIEKWSKEEKVKTPIHQPFSKGYIRYEPYGVALIIAPFNYPFQLAIEPLIGAIAAGNTVVLKPSEYTTHTEAILVKIIAEAFDASYVSVVCGDREVVTELIHAPFDYIFFTGSVPTGKIVMKAAAENLVPVTLELGGKSPVVVHEDANIETAAKRIVWGKFMNAGQICIAPDYIYVHENVEKAFLDALSQTIIEFYGALPQKSADYCRIVNEKQFHRLTGLIDHEKVIIGGQYDVDDLYIAPTVMKNVAWEDAVMADEIFGPILPVLTYTDIEGVIEKIKSRPKPLAFYVFSESERVQEHLLDEISFGGGCVNDTLSHVASQTLPFGGVGHSGMGAYHGEYSFKTFSHRKSIVKKSSQMDVKMIYPPYKNRVHWLKKLMK